MGIRGRDAVARRIHCLAGNVKERLAVILGDRVLSWHTVDDQELQEKMLKLKLEVSIAHREEAITEYTCSSTQTCHARHETLFIWTA